jgi:citrate lyase subunit beta/citryl-CoA lyase
VLPKYESADTVAEIRARLPGAALVIAGLETARGVADCRRLLAHGVDAVYFGAEDYIADLGGHRTGTGEEVLYARSKVMLAARLAGVGAIDQAVVAIRDDARFVADAETGKSIGYTGKICVHPRQVELAHQVFTPSPEEIEHARQILEMAETGAGTLGGEMVDEVHVRMARQLIARAEPRPSQDGSG